MIYWSSTIYSHLQKIILFSPNQQLQTTNEDINNNWQWFNLSGHINALVAQQNYYDVSTKDFSPYLLCMQISDEVSMMFQFLLLQTILKNLISLPCIFNLEAKCSYMKNRVLQVILAWPNKKNPVNYICIHVLF